MTADIGQTRPRPRADAATFRDAMASFPSGVTVVTTTDAHGQPWGFTASAFCSVSAEPPLVLVCLATTAQCHAAFQQAETWMINIIHNDQADIALRFATRGADKFGGEHFTYDNGLPELHGASANLHCTRHTMYTEGDHTILVGEVTEARTNPVSPAIYFNRDFHRLPDARRAS
jgi:flavin reductase ActVB